ncbi:MAG: ATP-binding protein [Defluviitaleaceae bacterium]|nr:ATP-binding protein [Defluviitaleaceae bacterium]
MKLLLILGNASVGKMTVGQEIVKITDFRLFHNHVMIEPILEIFGFNNDVIVKLRDVVFQEFVKTDLYGLIFTYMWDFDEKAEWASRKQIDRVCEIFEQANAEIYVVELVASQEVRLQRNVTENRLKNKVSKLDIERSNQMLINDDIEYRCESRDGEVSFANYIKIDNTDVSPEEVAKMVKEKFSL